MALFRPNTFPNREDAARRHEQARGRVMGLGAQAVVLVMAREGGGGGNGTGWGRRRKLITAEMD